MTHDELDLEKNLVEQKAMLETITDGVEAGNIPGSHQLNLNSSPGRIHRRVTLIEETNLDFAIAIRSMGI